MYVLTKEGESYRQAGLPEKRLVELLEAGPLSLKEAQQVPDFSIAFQWAKKHGWITVQDNRIVLVKKPASFPEQEALENIRAAPDEVLTALEKRKLVKKLREGIREQAAKHAGKEITILDDSLIKTGMWKSISFKPYNVAARGELTRPGKLHPYLAFLDYVKSRLVSLGFAEMTGPIVETEFWNMDALYMPQHHSARDIHDAYFVKDPKYADSLDAGLLAKVREAHEAGVAGSRGWQYSYDARRAHRHILRTHGTVLSAKTLASSPSVPGKYFSIARCFRYDVIDATHLPDFFQVEGIIIDKELNFRHLAGILRMFAKEFANSEKIKLVPAYFPFTEPSVELHAEHPELGWMELGGAGIFRQELTSPLGIKEPVLAWGLGIDRIAMFTLGINDIRDLFSSDIEYLRNSKVIY